MASKTTTYLVTGASRGIGYGLVEALVQRPGVTVVASIRDIAKRETVEQLNAKAGDGSKIVAVQLRVPNTEDAQALPKTLTDHGVNHLDVVIANAGIAKHYGPIATTPLDEMRDHFEVNTIGVVELFQAVAPFLERSENPKFVYVSSAVGSLTVAYPMPNAAYGASKAAANFALVKIHQENPKLTAFPISPGWVQTDMGNKGATLSGLENAPETLEGSVSGILNRVDNATREKDGGKFKDYKEDDIPW
ncbi:Short-chain dehydrogenase/reductase SDR [Macrophomina phaseolina MS6]|uniref:Short-chain dehydrogenase/reductase SDR n=1 Tax=Macrophomina phaseolina (strain MS6) TaxID=1126212 RepID=K2RX01_MACPH|nr:Short-chain dehydrogenase/reductase SDR [Macrophomina phaseolina MS6]